MSNHNKRRRFRVVNWRGRDVGSVDIETDEHHRSPLRNVVIVVVLLVVGVAVVAWQSPAARKVLAETLDRFISAAASDLTPAR